VVVQATFRYLESKIVQAENIKQLLMGKIQKTTLMEKDLPATTSVFHTHYLCLWIPKMKWGRGLWPILVVYINLMSLIKPIFVDNCSFAYHWNCSHLKYLNFTFYLDDKTRSLLSMKG
jgi:hypothetical protein